MYDNYEWVCHQKSLCPNSFLVVVGVAVNHTCSSDEFTCTNGRCTPMSWLCDADNDCGDMSDEQSCPPHSCLPTEFTCQSPAGTCIPQRFRCDHQYDCSDGSDELDCRKFTHHTLLLYYICMVSYIHLLITVSTIKQNTADNQLDGHSSDRTLFAT